VAVIDKIDKDLISPSDSHTLVDFEIVFAALLSAILFTLPLEGILAQISALTGVGLLLVTFIRRLTVNAEYSNQKRIFSTTMILIDFLSIAGFLLISTWFAGLANSIIPFSVDIVVLAAAFAIVLSLGILAFQELVFRDLFLWVAVLFQNKTVDNPDNEVGRLLQDLSITAYEVSLAKSLEDELVEKFEDFRGKDVESKDLASKWGSIIGMSLAILIYVVLGVVSYFIFGGVRGLLIVTAAMFIPLPIEFWYSKYGYSDYEEFIDKINRISLTILLMIIFYTAYAYV